VRRAAGPCSTPACAGPPYGRAVLEQALKRGDRSLNSNEWQENLLRPVSNVPACTIQPKFPDRLVAASFEVPSSPALVQPAAAAYWIRSAESGEGLLQASAHPTANVVRTEKPMRIWDLIEAW